MIIRLTNSLLEFDVPEIFIGETSTAQKILCISSPDLDRNGDISYTCTPISCKRLAAVLNSELDIFEIFRNPEEDIFFKTTELQIKELNYFFKSEYFCNELSSEYLPDEGLFIRSTNSICLDAEELKSTVAHYSLLVDEATLNPAIRVDKFGDFLNIIQSCVNNISRSLYKKIRTPKNQKKPILDLSTVATDFYGMSHGSFVAKIKGSGPSNIFNDQTLISESFSNIGKLFELSEDKKATIEFIKSQKGHAAASLFNLIKFSKDHNCTIKSSWATPFCSTPINSNLNHKNAISIYEEIFSNESIFTEESIFTGVFLSANTKNLSFIFKNDENEIIKGNVKNEETHLLDGITLKTKRYKIFVTEEQHNNKINGKTEYKYFIEKIKKTRKTKASH